MKSKPAKYGIKIFAMTCARTFYTNNLEIYGGRQPEGPFETDNSTKAVVERMIQPISGTGRNVTTDNWFTSIPLCGELLQNHRLTLVGTLRKDKREIPPFILEKKERKVGTSIFCFKNGCTLVSYQAKKNKNVVLLSSMHDDNAIDNDPTSKTFTKPEIILFYNSSKGGVDNVDKYKETYSVARITNRWPMRVFYSVLDIAGINTFIVLKANTNEQNMVRRNFLKSLGRDLCIEQLMTRINIRSTPTMTKKRIRQILGIEDRQHRQPPADDIITGRCYCCDWRKNRPSKTRCSQCKYFICKEHSGPARCINCVEGQEEMDVSDNE